MPKQARVTTRTGDAGDTSLFGKGRFRKTDARIEALGDLDEAQATGLRPRALLEGRQSDADSQSLTVIDRSIRHDPKVARGTRVVARP